MALNIWQHNERKTMDSTALKRHPFRIFSTALLSLLLPLSFLHIARLTTARYQLDIASNSTPAYLSFLSYLFLQTNLTLLHGLVSIFCVLSLVHGLISPRVILMPLGLPLELIIRSRLYTVCIFLCTLQVLVGLGIEGGVESGAEGLNFGYERNLLSKLLFFIGLHETMLYWSRKVVRPVVDDAFFGSRREERWNERMIMAASFSTLWWWRLKDEVESLVVVAEVKTEMLISVSLTDFLSWWLYYLTVTIGIVRLIKSLLWIGFVLFSNKVEHNADEFCVNEEKV